MVVGDFGLCDYYDEGWSLMCLLYEKGAGEWLDDSRVSCAATGFSDGNGG